MEKNWKTSRFYTDTQKYCKQAKNVNNGYKRTPILQIDFKNVIPDILYLLLRIGGVLIQQLIAEFLNNLSSSCAHKSTCECKTSKFRER